MDPCESVYAIVWKGKVCATQIMQMLSCIPTLSFQSPLQCTVLQLQLLSSVVSYSNAMQVTKENVFVQSNAFKM